MTPSDGVGHALSQSQGIGDPVSHRSDVNIRPGESIVLCTDGVHRELSVGRIAEIVRDKDPHNAVKAVLQEVEKKGVPDNATVVVCRYN